jgi:hypothetical protein
VKINTEFCPAFQRAWDKVWLWVKWLHEQRKDLGSIDPELHKALLSLIAHVLKVYTTTFGMHEELAQTSGLLSLIAQLWLDIWNVPSNDAVGGRVSGIIWGFVQDAIRPGAQSSSADTIKLSRIQSALTATAGEDPEYRACSGIHATN